MTNADVRWKQRFSNYKKAHRRLKDRLVAFERVRGSEKEEETVIIEALIKCFELTFELAWQTMKDYISYQGFSENIGGSRDAIRGALQMGLIDDGQTWIDMIGNRNRASHSYDEENARRLASDIAEERRYGLFAEFEEKMETLL